MIKWVFNLLNGHHWSLQTKQISLIFPYILVHNILLRKQPIMDLHLIYLQSTTDNFLHAHKGFIPNNEAIPKPSRKFIFLSDSKVSTFFTLSCSPITNTLHSRWTKFNSLFATSKSLSGWYFVWVFVTFCLHFLGRTHIWTLVLFYRIKMFNWVKELEIVKTYEDLKTPHMITIMVHSPWSW